MPAVVAAPSSGAAAAEPREGEMPPLPQQQQPAERDDSPPTTSSSSSSSSSEDEGGDRKRKKARANASKPRPPPALRWMRVPLNVVEHQGGATGTSSARSLPSSSVPLERILGLDPRLEAHLRRNLGFGSLLPVQAAVWAAAAGGRAGAAHDLAVAAPTGSGKTLAYGLPLLHSLLDDDDCERLNGGSGGAGGGGEGEEGEGEGGEGGRRRLRRLGRPRRSRRLGQSLGALVVVPTRDLAEQVAAVLGPAGASVGLRTALLVGGGGGGGGGRAEAAEKASPKEKPSSRPPPPPGSRSCHSFHHPASFAEEAVALVGRGSALRRGWCGDYASPALLPERETAAAAAARGGEEEEEEGEHHSAASSASDVVVATPGRLAAHLSSLGPSAAKGALRGLRFLVVDEADRLLRQEYGGWAAALGAAAPAVGGFGGWGGGEGGFEGGEEEDGPGGGSSFSALLQASRRRCVRLAASATLTRDPAKLARLRLWRPRFVAVGGGWDREEEEGGEGGEEAKEEEEEQEKGEVGGEEGIEGGSSSSGSEEEEEGGPEAPSTKQQRLKQPKVASRYALPAGLSLRRVDVGGRGGANKPAVLLALLRVLAARGQRSVVFCASVAGAVAVARFLESVEPPLRLSRGEGEEEEGEEAGEEERARKSVGLLAAASSSAAAAAASSPAERRAALRRFAAFELPVLVCSDGATRGLDLGAGGRTSVVSYDPPSHAKALVHRAGRAVRGEGGGGGGSGGGGGGGGGADEAGGGDSGDDDGKKKKKSSASAAAVGTAYTLLRPQDAAFHKELLRKVAGEGALAAKATEGGGGGPEEKAVAASFSPAAAQQLLKALKLPKAALREARKEAEAAVARLSAAAASASGGGGGGRARDL